MEPELLQHRLLEFVRARCAADGVQARIDGATPLLEEGWIDSKRMVDLLAWLEQALGIEVPDTMLSGEHFRDAASIARAFCALQARAARAAS